MSVRALRVGGSEVFGCSGLFLGSFWIEQVVRFMFFERS